MTDAPRPEPRAPLEYRSAELAGVNFDQRIITVIAVPYDQEALVEYRGEMWRESVLPGAFDGIETRPNRITANRNHDKSKSLGKALRFWPSRPEGLVAEIRVARTPLGDETLALADEDVVRPSVGFGVRGSDQILERPFRKIKRAFLDHIAFVETPAYAGAQVLTVREGEEEVLAKDLPRLVTPKLDEVSAWLNSRRIS